MRDPILDEAKVNCGEDLGESAQLDIKPWVKLRSTMMKTLENLLNCDG